MPRIPASICRKCARYRCGNGGCRAERIPHIEIRPRWTKAEGGQSEVIQSPRRRFFSRSELEHDADAVESSDANVLLFDIRADPPLNTTPNTKEMNPEETAAAHPPSGAATDSTV